MAVKPRERGGLGGQCDLYAGRRETCFLPCSARPHRAFPTSPLGRCSRFLTHSGSRSCFSCPSLQGLLPSPASQLLLDRPRHPVRTYLCALLRSPGLPAFAWTPSGALWLCGTPPWREGQGEVRAEQGGDLQLRGLSSGQGWQPQDMHRALVAAAQGVPVTFISTQVRKLPRLPPLQQQAGFTSVFPHT